MLRKLFHQEDLEALLLRFLGSAPPAAEGGTPIGPG
jgi:hypothetical protein